MVESAGGTYRIKRICFLLLAALWILLCPRTAAAQSSVFDRAGLFSGKECKELEELAQKLEKKYKMNFLLLTTAEAGGLSASQYAEAFYEDEGYDTNGKKGGIVLLIDMDNREMNLVTDGNMIYYITDEREEKIYDAGEASVRRGEYGNAMYAMLKKTEEYMEAGIPGNQYVYDTETGKIIRYRSVTVSEALIAFAAALLCAGTPCIVICRRYSSVRKYEYEISQNAGMELLKKEDRLVNQFVTKRRIPKSTSSGGGGGGGRSSGGGGRTSVHRSSSGRSYGGGHGRKF